MLKMQRILVPFDFSASAEEALAGAYALAESSGATLHLLYVALLHGDGYGLATYPTEQADVMSRRLKALLEARIVEGVIPEVVATHSVVRDIAAGPAILQEAADRDVDLIVIGTHGRRGVRRWLLGSVAEEVVRLSPCPVLTVRATERDREAPAVPGILVPVDFSTHAVEALRYAKQLAHARSARLDLVHVIEETLHPAFYNAGVGSIYDVQPNIEAMAIDHLRRTYEAAEGPACPYHLHVLDGHAAAEIVRFAEKEASDLIVMATHGLTGLEHFLIGSVAGRVVRAAPCPVFTVKSFGKSLLLPTVLQDQAVVY